jgi:hypothetical protein
MAKTKTNSPPPVPFSAEEAARIKTLITNRAYELWQQAGCIHGNDKFHWLQAEREVQEEEKARTGGT